MARPALGRVVLVGVLMLIGTRVAAAQQKIPVSKTPEPSCDYDGDGRACGTARLPDGVVLRGGCALVARRGKTEAVVADLDPSDGEAGDCPVLRAVVLHDNGMLDVETTWPNKVRVTREHLYSRLELAAALRLEKKKRPEEAREALERALALEPDFEDAAFALARVGLGLGETQRAATALAPFANKRPMPVYARVLAERALHPLLEHEPLVFMRSEKPGTAKITDVKKPLLAYATERSLFALVQRRRMHTSLCGPCFETNVVVFDATGLHAVLPLLVEEPGLDERKQRKALRQRLVTANRFLADLGFDTIPDLERVSFAYKQATGTHAASFPKARLAIAFRDGMARVVRGDQVLREQRVHLDCTNPKNESAYICVYPGRPHWAVRIPASDTLIFEWSAGGAEGHDIITVIEVLPPGSPGGQIPMPPGSKLQ